MGLISEIFSCCLLRTIDSYSKARPCVQDNTQWHMLDMAAFGDSQTPPSPTQKKNTEQNILECTMAWQPTDTPAPSPVPFQGAAGFLRRPSPAHRAQLLST